MQIAETGSSMVNLDFISKWLVSAKDGYNSIIMIAHPLTNRVRWKVAMEQDLMQKTFAREFDDMWVLNMGILDDIFSNSNQHFLSDFLWSILTAVRNVSGPSLQVQVRVETEPLPCWQSMLWLHPICQFGYGSMETYQPVRIWRVVSRFMCRCQ